MNKLERYALVVSLVAQLKEMGSWCGETHIQKSVYIVTRLFPEVFDYDYILYKYGPYSFELSNDIGTMVAEGYLEVENMRPYGPMISPGKLALSLMDIYSKQLKNNEVKINVAAKAISDKDTYGVEALSTALYIATEEAPKASHKEWIKRLQEIKPHIDGIVAQEAIEQVSELLAS